MNEKKAKMLRRLLRQATDRTVAQHEANRAAGVTNLPEITEEQLLRLQKQMARRIRRLAGVMK